MSEQEFIRWSAALKTYFPKENLLPTKESMSLWFQALSDLPYDAAKFALMKHVQVCKFAPSIAEIREAASKLMYGEMPDWGEGWRKALEAIRRYGHYAEREALASMDDLTRETVRRLGYMELCMSEDQMQDRANFRMIYEQLAKRKREDEAIPPAIKEMTNKMKLSRENDTLSLSERNERRNQILDTLEGISHERRRI